MEIYIDESGGFVPVTGGGHSVSAIAALVIPDNAIAPLLREIEVLAAAWGKGPQEIKGRELHEQEFAQLHAVLQRFDVILTVAAIDLGIHTAQHIATYKEGQAARLVQHITPETHSNVVRQLHELADRIRALPDQLYIQMILLRIVVDAAVQLAVLHYAQSDPAALGRFAWRLDAKDAKITNYEDLWRTLVTPFLESSSLREPMIFLRGGNYAAFDPFQNPDLPAPPEHLRPHARHPNAVFSSCNIKKILLDDLVFADSKLHRGLQLADTLANCFRRACNGRLQQPGWQSMGPLLMKDPRRHPPQAIRTCILVNDVMSRQGLQRLPYWPVIECLHYSARDCLTRPA